MLRPMVLVLGAALLSIRAGPAAASSPANEATAEPSRLPGALGPEGVTIDPTTTAAYKAPRVWHPKRPPAGAPAKPHPCRIVSYADKWTRHGLSTYMSWRWPNGPMAKRRQWQIPWEEQLVHKQDYDVDVDGRTADDYVAAHVFSLDVPLSNPRWPLHMAYPERFNEIFYGGAAWYLADTEPGTHRVWVEQGYNPDHSPPWFDNRAEDHPLQGQANEYEIGSGVRVYWAILWKKEDFLNDGDRYRVTFDENSRLAAITARTYWLGYDDVRLVVQDGGRLYISDTSQYEVPVRGYPPPANGRVFCVHPTRATWAEYHPKGHLIHFEPTNATFKKHDFKDVQAVGWYLAKHSLKTGTQAHLKWYGFEADAVVHRPPAGSVHIDMVRVPGDGGQGSGVGGRGSEVGVPEFYLATCEVPYALWKRIHRWGNAPFNTLQRRYVYDKLSDVGSMLFEPAHSDRPFSPDEPVTNMTLYDALAWCNTLSEYEGKTPCYYVDPRFKEIFKNQHLWTRAQAQEPVGGRKRNPLIERVPDPKIYVKWGADGHRLPTAAEWRAAFKAGKTRTDSASATIAANSREKTQPVGSRKANALGVYDMIGNVWELVWAYGDVFDPATMDRAVALGGDFHYPGDPTAPENAASPYGDVPYGGDGNVGLRLLRREAGLPPPPIGTLAPSPGYYPGQQPLWIFRKGEKTAARQNPRPVEKPVLQMVSIPGGRLKGFTTEVRLPIDVTVSDFAIAKYPTTYAKWKQVLQWAQAGGYTFSHTGDLGSMYWYRFDHSPQEPVTHLTWHDMVVWCNALSEMEGRTPCYYEDPKQTQVYRHAFKHRPIRMSGEEAVNLGGLKKFDAYLGAGSGTGEPWLFVRWDTDGYRLPTRAEYEYAARGGARSRKFWPQEDRNQYTWNIFNSGGRTHPVGLKEPNPFGLYDIVGNVTHWLGSTGANNCDPKRPLVLDTNNPKMDRYHKYHAPGEYALRGTGPTGAGPSFLADVSDDEISPEMYYPDVGFRVVRCQPGTHPRNGKEPLEDPKGPFKPKIATEPTRMVGTGALPVARREHGQDARATRATHGHDARAAPRQAEQVSYSKPSSLIRLASYSRHPPSSEPGDVSADACWRGNLRRTGQYDTEGVTRLKGLKWKFLTAGKVRSGPVAFDGLVYVGSDGGHFHAVDSETGKQRWKIPVEGGVRSSACVAGGTVYFGGGDGKLYAAEAKTGKIVWTAQGKGYLSTSPAVAYGMVFVEPAIGFDAETGRHVWGPRGARLSGFRHPVDSSLAIVGKYLVQNGGTCDLETARFAFGGGSWARQVTDAVAGGVIYTCQTGVGGGMYGDKGNGTLHAVDLLTGEPKWEKTTHRKGTPQAWREVLMCSPAVHHGIVYVGSEHGELFALDAERGTELWAFDAGSAIRSAPSISTRDGMLYFGAGDGKIYALDANSGQKRWEFQTGDKIVSSPCPDHGWIYVGSDDRYLYALEGR